jgi:hypothetical protein
MKVVFWSDGVMNCGKDTDMTCLKCIFKKMCHRRIILASVMHNITVEFECPDLIPKEVDLIQKDVKDETTSKT